jgi:hypothetical protein
MADILEPLIWGYLKPDESLELLTVRILLSL